MYRIKNVSRDSKFKTKRKVATGRKSRTKVYRFQGRRIVSRKSILISDELYEAAGKRLAADQAAGLIVVTKVGGGIVSKAMEAPVELPVIEEVVTTEEGLEEVLEEPVLEEPVLEEPEEETEPEEPEEDEEEAPDLSEMTVRELRALAEERGVDIDKLKKKADIVAALEG